MSILPLYLRPSVPSLEEGPQPLARRRRLRGLPSLPVLAVAVAYLLLGGVLGLGAVLAHLQSV